MAELTIRLEIDPATGKKNIIVSLQSDADALPHEHEQQHRVLVEKLLQSGLVTASELGQVIVEREESSGVSSVEDSPNDPERSARRAES